MADFTMPSLGADMDAGTLVEWLIKPGDHVERGQIVAVVETQKGAIDVEIFEAGEIIELLVPEGEKVPVGTVLAHYRRPDEGENAEPAKADVVPEPTAKTEPEPAEPKSEPAEREPDPPLQPTAELHPNWSRTQTSPQQSPPPTSTATSVPAGVKTKASPRARRLAEEHGVDLEHLRGTGPEGSIVGDDVLAAVDRDRPSPRPARAAAKPASAMREAIAAAMARSKREIPHYYLAHSVELEAALSWLEAQNEDLAIAERLLPITLFVRAVARALGEQRALNGWWRDGGFVAADGVHVGLAVALRGGGLVNPALRDADQGSLVELNARIRDLSTRARRQALRASELDAASVTVTSLGDRGVDLVLPIIAPPQVAIVGVGTVRRRPWVVEDAVVPRRVVELGLAADHRASDGHTGARFLARVDALLQAPEEL